MMDAKTEEALHECIAHWEEVVKAKKPDEVQIGPKFCALCGLFFTKTLCEGCPVAEVTGEEGCDGTPYYDVFRAIRFWEDGDASREDFQKAAQDMLDFLKALLPEGKP